MRFNLGGIPESQDFTPDGTWKPLREPTPWVMQVVAIPLGFIVFIIVGALWFYLTPLKSEQFESNDFLILGLASFVPLIVVHEMIHALIHPQSGKSDQSILGFWPSRLLFYAHFDGELTRNRFVVILAMPTLLITLLPLAVAITTNSSHSLVAWVSTWNAFFACGDLFGIILLLFQVPSHATVRNKGWRSYWKVSDAS